jgi:hypothetical protein
VFLLLLLAKPRLRLASLGDRHLRFKMPLWRLFAYVSPLDEVIQLGN